MFGTPYKHKKLARQRGNGIADSVPSGSGNLKTHIRKQRLPFAHPLQPFEPDPGSCRDLTLRVPSTTNGQ